MEEAVALRTGLGQFQPGASGNAGGRPRKTDDVRKAEALAAKESPASMRKLVRMRDNPKVSEAGQIRAAELLLAYGIGKPQVRADAGLVGYTLLVQAAPVPDGPIPGVINSPIASHVALPRVPLHQVTTIDEAAP